MGAPGVDSGNAGYVEHLALQGRKIQELLKDNELLGAQQQKMEEALLRAERGLSSLKSELDLISEDETLNHQLSQGDRIDLTLQELRRYCHRVGSPAHRLVSYTVAMLSRFKVGRGILKGIDWLYVIMKG